MLVTWGFPKIRGTLLGVPIIRTIVFWVYIGVPSFWETTTSCWGRVAVRVCVWREVVMQSPSERAILHSVGPQMRL